MLCSGEKEIKIKQKTILFDLDGTLIDSTPAILESFFVVFEKNKITNINENDIKKLIGYPLESMFISLGIDKKDASSFVLRYKHHYRQIANQKTKLLPFAKEAVQKASKFARLGVVTTKTAKYSKEILLHLGIGDYFETLIGFEDVSNPKPHSEPILKALKEMNVQDKKNSWMIGDTNLDIKSAKNAKINHIAVLGGYESRQDLLKHTDQICNNVLEAVQKIDDF